MPGKIKEENGGRGKEDKGRWRYDLPYLSARPAGRSIPRGRTGLHVRPRTACRRPPLYSGATTGDRTSPSRSWLAAAPARHYGRRGASPLTDRSRRLPPFRSKAYVRAPVCVCVCFAASTRHDRTSWPRPEFGNGFTMDAEARACKVF